MISFFRIKRFVFVNLFAAYLLLGLGTMPAAAQEASDSAESLAFSRPLITIYPSVESELRLSYSFENKPLDEGVENEVEAEIEYELIEGLAVEIEVPFTFVNPGAGDSEQAFNNLEAGLKFANTALEKYSIGMAYGFTLSLPTGNDSKGIGSDSLVSLEPFYSFGYSFGETEAIISTALEIPLNSDNDEEDETELEYSSSLLQRLPCDLKGFIEVDGSVALNGDEQGKPIVNLSPGIKGDVADEVELGLGIGFPLTDEREFNTRVIVTLFGEF